MGSTSHLANELGKVVRDHSTTDGRIVYYRTPYARMTSIDLINEIDLGSYEWFETLSCDIDLGSIKLTSGVRVTHSLQMKLTSGQ
jgi:hypothetical protein